MELMWSMWSPSDRVYVMRAEVELMWSLSGAHARSVMMWSLMWSLNAELRWS